MSWSPTVDYEGSRLKVYERASRKVPIKYISVTEVTCHSKKYFIHAYIYKHGRWPPVEVTGNCHRDLFEAHRINNSTTKQLLTNTV